MIRRQRTSFDTHPARPFRLWALGLRSLLATLVLLVLFGISAHAKVTVSIASGNWSSAATWNNGVPADGDQITINVGHTVTLTADVNFLLAGSTLTTNGTLNLSTFFCRVVTNAVSATGQVIQNTTSGTAQQANLRGTSVNLNLASTYSYTGNQIGFTGVHPAYGNLVYASTSAANGAIEINLNVGGNLTVNNTGAGELRFGDVINRSHLVGGTFTVTAGNVAGTNATANVAMDVNGNLVISAGATFKACNSTGNLTINLAGNFTQNGTVTSPGSGLFRITFDGTGNSTIAGTLPVALQYVTMQKTGAGMAVLAQHLTIGKNLTFANGRIQIGNFNLTMAALATITGASAEQGYVVTNSTGKLIFAQTNPSTDFPVGNTDYTPINLFPATSASAFGVRVVDGLTAESSGCTGFVTDDAVKKMWIVTRESGTATLLSLTPQWELTNEGITFDRTVCGVVRYTGGNWEAVAPGAATGANPYQRNRVLPAGVIDGTFGVLDNSAVVNISAPTGSSNSPICAGATLNLTRTSPLVVGAVYQWSKQSGGFFPPAGPNASIANAQPVNSGNYLLTLTKYGCAYTSSAVATTVNPLPNCSITGPMPVCANTTSLGYSGPVGMSSYIWSISGTGSIPGATTTKDVTVTAGGPGSFTLTLTVTDAAGCKSTCTKAVTVQNRPTGVLSGDTTICLGQTATLRIVATGTGPWSGTLSGGIPFSGLTSPILVGVTPSMTTTYTLATLVDVACTASPNDLSGSAKVTIDELQMFSVVGGGAYCAGDAGAKVGLNGSEIGVDYQLYLNGNTVGAPVPGTGSPISFGPQPGAGTYTAVGTRTSSDCDKSMMGSVVVTVNPLPSVSLSLGDDSATAIETNVPLTGGSPTGGVFSGPGVSGSAINPMAAGIGAHTIVYTVTDNNGCSNTATDIFTVSAVPGLNLFIDAPDTAQCGQEFFVDITAAANFTDLGTLQFSVLWDGNVFTTVGIEPQTIDNSTPLTGFIGGTLIYSWLDSSGMYGASVPDGTLLLRLRLKALNCGSSGVVSIVNAPRVIEASDIGLNVVPVVLLGLANIKVEDTQPPTFVGVPANTTVSCDNVPAVTNPTATDNCDNAPQVMYLGQDSVPSTCPYKYLLTRKWKATDACGNSTTTAQTIVVNDTTAPTFAAPANTTISLNGNCQYNADTSITGRVTNAMDNCSPKPNLIISFSDSFLSGSGGQGTLQRTWIVTDQCGNTASSQVQTITVRDQTPPTISCPNNVTVQGTGGECEFAPVNTQYDPTVSDNCGVSGTTYTLSGATTGSGVNTLNGVFFSIGTTIVVWTATDANGNTATCSFTITLAPCSGISGKLIWKGDPTNVAGVAQAMVALSGDATDLYGPTIPDGLYTLVGSGNVTIKPTKTAPPALPMNGVTIADALILEKHLDNTAPITDPYKLIAADIDSNNIVNTTDWQTIRRALQGAPSSIAFFTARPWRFVPTPTPGPGFPGYTPGANPFALPIPNSRPLLGVMGGVSSQDFFGMKTGDLNYDANPNLKPEPQPPVLWLAEDRLLKAGQEYTVAFRVARFSGLAAYQFALKFETEGLQLLGVDVTNSPLGLSQEENFGLYQTADGEIRSIWLDPAGKTLADGTPAFALRFRALQGGVLLSELLRLETEILAPEAYTVEEGLSEIQLVFADAQTTDVANPAAIAGVRLLQNRPNPFSGTTVIGFVLPQACEAQLRVFDATGRELLHLNRPYPSGYSEEAVRLETGSAGMLYYELTTPFGSLVRRMTSAN
ncbi:MAG: HYR domain-containing protein [Saprospiraceae bacterium]